MYKFIFKYTKKMQYNTTPYIIADMYIYLELGTTMNWE